MNFIYEEELKELEAWKNMAQAEIQDLKLTSERDKKLLEAKLQKSEKEKISNFKTFYLEREEMATQRERYEKEI